MLINFELALAMYIIIVLLAVIVILAFAILILCIQINKFVKERLQETKSKKDYG